MGDKRALESHLIHVHWSQRLLTLSRLGPRVMRNPILLILIVAGVTPGLCDTATPLRVRPVCGNTENGIVVGKPKLFDDRTAALMVDSLETRLAKLRAHETKPQPRISEMLAETTQLTHQIVNLRSLSDRSLSDRVLLAPSASGSQATARAQTLLAFQISIDPKDRYSNALAEVEITVSSRGDTRLPPVLVALLPREKTYNMATVSKGQAGFGNAAIQAMATSDGKDSFYIIKDTDTIALERLTPVGESAKACGTGFQHSERDLTFAWQIRPVLGRDRVDAGTREVYALLALPTGAGEDYLADVHVHTHWRSLKHAKRKNAPEFLEDSARDELWTEAIRFNASEMELSLRPRIAGVRFVPNGKEEVLVVADGENFLADTAVMLGNVTVPGAALNIQRERHLQFVASAKLLTEFDPILTGRFGSPVPLVDTRALNQQWTSDPAWGLKIEYARARPKDAEQSEVRIKLKSRQRKRPLEELIVNNTLVSAAGRVFPVSGVETEPTDSDALMIRFDVPTALIRANPHVTVARLFGGDLYRDSGEVTLEDDISASNVNLLATTDEDVTLAVAGNGFSTHAVVQIGDATFTRWTRPELLVTGSTLITLSVKRELLKGVRQLTVTQGFAQPLILPLPESLVESSRSKSHKRR